MFRRYVGPFPPDRKGIDSENAMQGYTERPVGRPCIPSPNHRLVAIGW